jgi:hypothetical protein
LAKIANINATCKVPKEIKWVLGDIGKTPFKPLHKKKAKLMNFVKKSMNTLNATFINFFNKVTKTRFGSSHGVFHHV